jgi:hypothetical protein
MTIKLLAHILRGSPLAAGAAAPLMLIGRSLDLRRWVLEELVVRRWEPIGWRRQRQPPRRATVPGAHVAHGDSPWSDTQPWCHE